LHQLYSVIKGVEETHSGLGNAVAFSIICVKARMCLLVVSPAGCGKSTISDMVALGHPNAQRIDSTTTASLSQHVEEFSNFYGLVVIDDMGKIGDTYSRKHTLTAFAELCYSHFIRRYTFRASVIIEDFHGSAVLNVQPVILADVYQYPEWESVIQDKTLRYYHLKRPTKPNDAPPKVNIDWGIDIDLVAKPDHRYKLYPKLEAIGGIQWSDARTLEHLDTLLRASAALDRREKPNGEDFRLLNRLMKPMVVERYITSKSGFEVGRWMDTNLAAVLVEFASWRNISIDRIARDYKISPATTYRLLVEIKDWFVPSEPMSKKLVPKPELKRVLKEAGVDR